MSVTIDVKGLREGLVKIDALSGETKRATSKAINTAIPKIRNTIVDKTTQDYFISKANVKKTIDVKRANPSGLSAFIRSKGGPVALTKFRVTPKRPPKRKGRTVKAQVMRNGGGGTIPNAFIARMGSGHIGAVYRKGADRYPIGQFHGPAVPSMLKNAEVSAFVGNVAQEELLRQIGTSFEELVRK
ncbi:phage tail protein [Veillonella sp.]|uniref:phage tail protein n=1 Tax=Veillonella sp. TaxID=1926307 RepID=UPI002908095A|nr:phage tail protein [Veillonella sp.]MDU5294457.1 phage tail protein [Veillonella sp.]MDU5870077.1 phage tail protein [Veillonella sp.]